MKIVELGIRVFAAICRLAVPGVIAEQPLLIHGGHGDGSQTLGAGGRRGEESDAGNKSNESDAEESDAVAENLEKTLVRVLGVYVGSALPHKSTT